MSKAHNFFIVSFEGVRSNQTDEILERLMEEVDGYDHITGDYNWFLGYTPRDIKKSSEFKAFSDAISTIIHEYNDGLWFSFAPKTEEQVAHLL